MRGRILSRIRANGDEEVMLHMTHPTTLQQKVLWYSWDNLQIMIDDPCTVCQEKSDKNRPGMPSYGTDRPHQGSARGGAQILPLSEAESRPPCFSMKDEYASFPC